MDNSQFERILCSSRPEVSLTIASFWLVLLVSGPPLHAMQNEPDARLPADSEVTDASIAERLNAIYAEIEVWKAIDASVAQGVVTLDGEVFSSEAAEDAAALAERIDGVLLVRNRVAIASRHVRFYNWPLFASSRGHNDSSRIACPRPGSNEVV